MWTLDCLKKTPLHSLLGLILFESYGLLEHDCHSSICWFFGFLGALGLLLKILINLLFQMLFNLLRDDSNSLIRLLLILDILLILLLHGIDLINDALLADARIHKKWLDPFARGVVVILEPREYVRDVPLAVTRIKVHRFIANTLLIHLIGINARRAAVFALVGPFIIIDVGVVVIDCARCCLRRRRSLLL